MPPYDQIRKYQAVQVESATPEQLVVLAYDQILKSLQMSKTYMAQNKIEKTHLALKNAQLIILELIASLKLDVWEGAKNLLRLYDFMLRHIQQANLEKNPEPIDVILPMITELRNAWNEAYKQVRAQKGKPLAENTK